MLFKQLLLWLTFTLTSFLPHSTPLSTPLPLPSPSTGLINQTPTPKPLSFSDLNHLYGPCANIPTLLYHHIQDAKIAKTSGYQNLNVTPQNFTTQMNYLQTKNYSVISLSSLIAFFEKHSPLPNKPVLLTFDDGYADFYTLAYPILLQHNFPATLFLPTGLVNNPGYLNWSQISEMSTQNILFANHTWSHHSMASSVSVDTQEISVADTQLSQHNLNIPKVFAYPYGTKSLTAEKVLTSLNYQLAFTTIHGRILCARQNLRLPRLRIGDSPLSTYGL